MGPDARHRRDAGNKWVQSLLCGAHCLLRPAMSQSGQHWARVGAREGKTLEGVLFGLRAKEGVQLKGRF